MMHNVTSVWHLIDFGILMAASQHLGQNTADVVSGLLPRVNVCRSFSEEVRRFCRAVSRRREQSDVRDREA